MPKHKASPQELALMLERMKPSSAREDEWATMDRLAPVLSRVPTPAQEALVEPVVDPIDVATLSTMPSRLSAVRTMRPMDRMDELVAGITARPNKRK